MKKAKLPGQFLAATIFLALLCPLARAQQKRNPKTSAPAPKAASPPAELQPEELATGVWASPLPRGANVGWFTLSNYVIAIDSGVSDAEGRMILESIKKTTKGKPVRYLIITHAHGDHAGGARTFAAAGAIVLCQRKASAPIANLLYHPLIGSGDPLALAHADPTLEQIDHMLWISDTTRAAQIDHLGPAHTAGDMLIYLPKEKILFSGDIAVNNAIPFLQSSDADPENWIHVLDDVSRIPINRLVPGHGPIGSIAGVDLTRQYLEHALKVASELEAEHVSGERLAGVLGEPRYAFSGVSSKVMPDHIRNIEAVMRFLKEKKEPKTAPPTPAKTPPGKKPGA
jgi:cyclase